jgi:hypothetical protein
MKKLLPLLLAFFVPSLVLAAGFEGKVTMKMTGPKGAPPAMTFSIKEGFSRIDMIGAEGRNAAVILNAAKQEMTILMLDQKMYMTQAIPKPAAAATAAGISEGAAGTAVEVTTTKEKILGYDCVKYVAQTKEGTSEIWVTDQLGAFLGFGGGAAMGGGRRGPGASAPAPQGWEQALAGKGVFPLRVVTTAGGKESFRLEATNVEKASLPDSAFSAPADFRNLSDMMRGMGMPGGIPGMPGGMKIPGGE